MTQSDTFQLFDIYGPSRMIDYTGRVVCMPFQKHRCIRLKVTNSYREKHFVIPFCIPEIVVGLPESPVSAEALWAAYPVACPVL